jgi:protein-S-isoprenylcysteine O-methyltransferase Ste14
MGVEKIWETFFTSKEKDARKHHGDWTLMVTSLAYFLSVLLVITEFFYVGRKINILFFLIGLLIYFPAGILRYWSIKTLGDQWAIHLVSKPGLGRDMVLVRKGPYKRIRHPIYLGHFLELVGIAVIFNAFYTLIFIIVVNLPLYIKRAIYEEKILVARVGEDYLSYKKETSFMFPVKFFSKKK